MNRRERRQAKRDREAARTWSHEAKSVEVGIILGNTVATIGRIADDLEAGRLDPGTHARAEFITDTRKLQDAVAEEPERAFERLMYAFALDPEAVRALISEGE